MRGLSFETKFPHFTLCEEVGMATAELFPRVHSFCFFLSFAHDCVSLGLLLIKAYEKR